MRLFYKPAVALALLAMSAFGCEDAQDQALNPEENAREILDASFTDYEIVTLDNARILGESAAKKDVGFRLDLGIPSHPEWHFDVQHHQSFDDDFKSFESTPDGGWVEVEAHPGRNDAFYGTTPESEDVHGMFIMMDDNLEAEIFVGEVDYALTPVTFYDAAAAADKYVLYRLDADIAAADFQCGTDDVPHNTTLKEDDGANEKMDRCRELSVNYIADYEMYRNKFGSNRRNVTNYIDNRMQFGSYRYWGRNNFALYFRLLTRYVRQNSRNRPMTSNDKAIALDQFVRWSNNTDNMRYADTQVLFTGKDFGGLLGRAKVGATCRRASSRGNYLSRAMVTRLNRISAGVYNKVVAHEIGHNLGASHQSSGFMQQGSNQNAHMPRATRSELARYINNNNSCLSVQDCRDYRGL